MNTLKTPEDLHISAAHNNSKEKVTFRDYFELIASFILMSTFIAFVIICVQSGYIPWYTEVIMLIMVPPMVVHTLVAVISISRKTFKKDRRE